MNYAAEQRQRTIDLLVDHYGNVNRKVIMEMYGIGAAQATRDIRQYRETHPNNLVFSDKEKAYYKSVNFERKYK